MATIDEAVKKGIRCWKGVLQGEENNFRE